MEQKKLDEMINFFKTIDRMENLPRTGYFFAGVKQPESLAAHSFGVALIAMVLADTVKEDVDMERLLRLAILHDTTESVLTDIPHAIFKYLGQEAKEDAENKAALDLLAPIQQKYLEIWQEFDRRETLESRLVNAADKLQLMIKILNYERAGTGNFEGFWRNMQSHTFCNVHLARQLFERMVEMHEGVD